MNQLPTISSLLSTGWTTFKKNWKFITSAALLTIVIMIVLQIIKGATDRHIIAGLVMMIVSIIASIAIALGWSKVLLNFVRNGSAQWDDFKTKMKDWKGYIVALIIYNFFKVLALILFIPAFINFFGYFAINIGYTVTPKIFAITLIPLIIGIVLMAWLAVRYVFIAFIAVDDTTLSGWKILKKSAAMTKGNMWKIFWYSIIFGLVNLLGLICVVIGLFITVPMTKLAMAKLYDSLKEKAA
jgi:uncharacterized membrane protein